MQYLLLPLMARCIDNRCMYMAHVIVFMCVVVTVWGYVGMLLCSGRC